MLLDSGLIVLSYEVFAVKDIEKLVKQRSLSGRKKFRCIFSLHIVMYYLGPNEEHK